MLSQVLNAIAYITSVARLGGTSAGTMARESAFTLCANFVKGIVQIAKLETLEEWTAIGQFLGNIAVGGPSFSSLLVGLHSSFYCFKGLHEKKKDHIVNELLGIVSQRSLALECFLKAMLELPATVLEKCGRS